MRVGQVTGCGLRATDRSHLVYIHNLQPTTYNLNIGDIQC